MESKGVTIQGTVTRASFDSAGECKLTMAIPQSDSAMAAALAIQTDTVFEITFKPVG